MIYTAALTPEASLADMQSVMRVQPCGEAGVYLYVEQAYSGTSQKSTKRATGLDRGPAYEQNHTGNRSLAVCCSKNYVQIREVCRVHHQAVAVGKL